MNSQISSDKKVKLWLNSIFFLHLVAYIAVNAFLAFINLRTWPEELWFLWTTASWGMGVIIHLGINLIVFYILKNSRNVKESSEDIEQID